MTLKTFMMLTTDEVDDVENSDNVDDAAKIDEVVGNIVKIIDDIEDIERYGGKREGGVKGSCLVKKTNIPEATSF